MHSQCCHWRHGISLYTSEHEPVGYFLRKPKENRTKKTSIPPNRATWNLSDSHIYSVTTVTGAT